MLQFRRMVDGSAKPQLIAMMQSLYAEDPAGSGNTPSAVAFGRTIDFALAHPDRGRVMLFTDATDIVGYALLIPYWSNEFGGTLLFIDELFVISTARNRGIGRTFLNALAVEKPFEAVALALEVSPSNERARRFYGAVGFTPRTHTMLTYRVA